MSARCPVPNLPPFAAHQRRMWDETFKTAFVTCNEGYQREDGTAFENKRGMEVVPLQKEQGRR